MSDGMIGEKELQAHNLQDPLIVFRGWDYDHHYQTLASPIRNMHGQMRHKHHRRSHIRIISVQGRPAIPNTDTWANTPAQATCNIHGEAYEIYYNRTDQESFEERCQEELDKIAQMSSEDARRAQLVREFRRLEKYRQGVDLDFADPNEAPLEGCTCGLYGYFYPRLPHEARVLGAMQIWGKIIIHKSGLRAQYAKPLILSTTRKLSKTEMNKLAEKYEVQLVSNRLSLYHQAKKKGQLVTRKYLKSLQR